MELHSKQQIRLKFLNDRNHFIVSKKIKAAIFQKFIEYSSTILNSSSIIAGYYPVGSELDILPILKQFSQQSLQVALPIIKPFDLSLKFHPWTPLTKMITSKYASNILEPLDQEMELIPSIVIAPLIACDVFGNRIGSGKAMYDKTITRLRFLNPELIYIGICYNSQLLEHIQTEEHDQKLDVIITETQILKNL